MAKIEPNAYVLLDYTLKDDKGEVLDESIGEGGEPISYVHGYGMLVPGLEAGLAGLAVGDEKKISVSPAEGYGDRDDELVLEVDKQDFPDPKRITPGDEFVAESPDGDEVVMRVVELTKDGVIVDANHPLAGLTLHYQVRVREVRAATEEEIAQAAADLEEAEGHIHGPDCDHDHEHGHDHPHDDDGNKLVTLGKKPGGADTGDAKPADKKFGPN
jgi:FKBP-type peptidyl-prolyl cis-trans isomerase SlyD